MGLGLGRTGAGQHHRGSFRRVVVRTERWGRRVWWRWSGGVSSDLSTAARRFAGKGCTACSLGVAIETTVDAQVRKKNVLTTLAKVAEGYNKLDGQSEQIVGGKGAAGFATCIHGGRPPSATVRKPGLGFALRPVPTRICVVGTATPPPCGAASGTRTKLLQRYERCSRRPGGRIQQAD